MSLALDERARRAVERVGARVGALLEDAAAVALELHARSVSLEHVVCAAMRDEDSAAHEVVCHAFADPDTLYEEALALAPGLLVVASASTLPFSTGAVLALRAAHARRAESADGHVSTRLLASEAFGALDDGQRERLADVGFALTDARRGANDEPANADAIFAEFDANAKAALARANRLAAGLRAAAIGPAHVLLGALQVDEALAAETGTTFSRARLALAQDHVDRAPVPDRPLELGEELVAFLEGLAPGADSLGVLAALHAEPAGELAAMLARHKVTPELLRRSAGAFRDA